MIQKYMVGILGFCCGASFDLLAGQESAWQVIPKFKIDYPALQEVSGISRSQRFEDVFWVHNDSGDDALFKITIILIRLTTNNNMCMQSAS